MAYALCLLLLLPIIIIPQLAAGAPLQVPLTISPFNSSASNSSIFTSPIGNNISSSGNVTVAHMHVKPDQHSRLKYKSIYDICMSWKTVSQQRDYFCRRVKLDRAAAAKITREQVANALLSGPGPLPTTVLLALSADQDGEASKPLSTKGQGMGWRSNLAVQDVDRIGIAPVTRQPQHDMGSSVVRQPWLDTCVEGIILAGLLLLLLVMLLMIWRIVNDVMLVSLSSSNPFDRVGGYTC